MRPYHKIQNLHFTDDSLILTIGGQQKQFILKDLSPALARATDEERNAFEISPSGYGIHWPLIDEDISIDGLLGIVHRREPKRKAG